MDVSLEDIQAICIFCLGKAAELKNLRDINHTHLLDELLDIENNDVLQKVCSECVNIFQNMINFILKSKKNIELIKKLQTETPLKVEAACSENEGLAEDIESNDESGSHEVKCFKAEQVKSDNDLEISSNTSNNVSDNPEKRQIRCKNCKLNFSSKKDLNSHCEKGYTCALRDYECPECGKLFKKSHKLKTHMISHSKVAAYKCKECEKTFRFPQNLRRHTLLVHEGLKKFSCEECGKAFSRAHVLNEHKNIHTGHNPYICDYCGKGFKRYANHFIHVYRHKLINGEIDKSDDRKSYLKLQCEICNKIFASRGGLEKHMYLHQDEARTKPFLCTVCGKGFNSKSQLDSHMRSHTGERPFSCHLCGKKFKHKSGFTSHQLTHSGKKPHQCEQCEKCFTQHGHLKIHKRVVHCREKPFVCGFCGKMFALKNNLKVHTRIHTGEKPYVCEICNKSYYESTSLKKHMKFHGAGSSNHGYADLAKEEGTNPINSPVLE